MNPNSDLKNNESVKQSVESASVKASNAEVMASNAEVKASNADSSYAESRVAFYATRFAGYSDDELKDTVAHERKVRGWGSERSYFLAALRGECEKRGIDYCW